MIFASLCSGELGWEVAAWAPWLRGKAQGSEVRVLCSPGHEALYEDFATPVPVDPGWEITRRLCVHAWRAGERNQIPKAHYAALSRQHGATGGVFTPYDIEPDYIRPEGTWPPAIRGARFHRYGPDLERDIVVVHARSQSGNPERNWPEAKWAELRPYLSPRVVAIGGREGSTVPPECEDMRGIPMSDLVRILAQAEVVIGPSSGPLHLANLCGAPAIWWSPHQKDVRRYKDIWNPFAIQNVQASASWNAPVQDVVSAYVSAVMGDAAA